jgi:hypothetical protein
VQSPGGMLGRILFLFPDALPCRNSKVSGPLCPSVLTVNGRSLPAGLSRARVSKGPACHMVWLQCPLGPCACNGRSRLDGRSPLPNRDQVRQTFRANAMARWDRGALDDTIRPYPAAGHEGAQRVPGPSGLTSSPNKLHCRFVAQREHKKQNPGSDSAPRVPKYQSCCLGL